MKLIKELTEEVEYITEANEDGTKNYFVEGIIMQGDIKNRNGRMYPSGVLAKEMKRYNENYVSKRRAFGELGHPDGPTVNLDRTSHIFTDLRQEGANIVGKAKVMDTPMGKIVKNFIDEGAQLGISSRGMGSVRKNKEGIMEVQEDFMLSTAGDIVSDPSAPDAFLQGIMEGVEFYWGDDGTLKKTTAAEYAQMQIEHAYSKTNNIRDERAMMNIFENYFKNL